MALQSLPILSFIIFISGGSNGHITGPESCLDLNFISSLTRPHLSPCHDLPAPFPSVILFLSFDYLSEESHLSPSIISLGQRAGLGRRPRQT